jgi:hypothetical protein
MVTSPSSNAAPKIVVQPTDRPQTISPLEVILELVRRARTSANATALRFIAVNDTHLLAPFQQSVLWTRAQGVLALSSLIDVDTNTPYAQWLHRACTSLIGNKARAVSAADCPPDIAASWGEWLPSYGLWIPFGKNDAVGGLLFARDVPWRDLDVRLFQEWIGTWAALHEGHSRPNRISAWFRKLRANRGASKRAWLGAAALVAVLAFPVRLSVLVPGELVPANPVAVRAPFDGIVKTFLVRPNESVKTGQPLFAYDDAQLSSRLEVATETWRTATAEQRQFSQQAFNDAKARGALSGAKGNVEEKRIEVDFLRSQLERSIVTAPRDGVVFVDDPSEWIGRSVTAGQRILRLAEPDDREVEAWLPVGDAIALPANAEARLYLSASPLSPVTASVRYVAYEAVRRPDGHYAYRIRATLGGATDHRVGLKGTVRLSGERVPLIYWAMRRPLAAAREFLGL